MNIRSYILPTRRAGTHTADSTGIHRGEIVTAPKIVRRFKKRTAFLRPLPDFMIIGAAKSGTTALHKYLSEHPDTTSSDEKEPNYFAHNYHLGEAWYRSHFPVFGDNVFEASAAYLWHPDAPARVYAAMPDAKLIAVLRDPVERAWSHYRMVSRQWKDETLSFMEAIDAEPVRIKQSPYRFSYIARGRYLEQILRWHRYTERLLIVASKDLLYRPQSTYNECLRFLGLSAHAPAFRQYNVTPGAIEMPGEAKKKLTEYFTPLNEELFHYLGRRFDWNQGSQILNSPPPKSV